VQISSLGGQLSFPRVGAYSATKFAIEGLSEALAAEVAPFGITVLIVEPGSFRTGPHRGDTMRQTTPMPAYEDIVGPVRAQQAGFDGTQPGDPAEAAAAILDHLDNVRRELLAWEGLSRSTDFEK
jgi:NAD(P)-dependent dehydrogenase (short-subunit alcohol dehydrogenase family)